MTILEAMSDPKLFGSFFKRGMLRGDSWRAWRAFLTALFGLPLDQEAIEVFRRHSGRLDAPDEPFRECFVVAGRRSGKSLIAALVAVFLACFRDYSDVLAPGEVGTVMLLAADRRQARTILGYINAFLATPLLASIVSAKLKESIELTNRIRIEIHTSSFRSARGYTIVAAICDEVAFWSNEDSVSPDVEVLNALRPAMATVPGAVLLGISSPYAKRGALWEAYRDHFGKNSDVLVWKASSREMNPTLSRATVAAAYARDAAWARAEYGGEFREDIESFLSMEAIEACITSGCFELPFAAGQSYTAFVDPSGGRSDSMTLAIAHAEESGAAVLDVLREIAPPFSPEQVVAEFCVTLKKYGVSEVEGDRYAGEWPREQFEKRGVSYRVAENSKSAIYIEFLPALMSGQVRLLDNARLKNELAGLERRTARGGRDSIDHAPGSHDDVANAAAGAIVRAVGSGVAVYGLLDAVRDGFSGFLDFFRTEQNPRADNVGKKEAIDLEYELLDIPPGPPKRDAESPRSCSNCGATCLVEIGGAGLRCNQCGRCDASGLPAPNAVSRADMLAGKFQGRMRRLH